MMRNCGPKAPAPCRAEKGLTFIELIIVIGIVGILSAIAVVRLSNEDGEDKARLAIRQILADIQYAQELACTSGRYVEIQFNVAANSYHLRYGNGQAIRQPLGGREYLIRMGESPYHGVKLAGTNLTDGVLGFDYTGAPYSGKILMEKETMVVSLNQAAWITMAPFTGKMNLNFTR
jgi:prepilin-type N-terminal cleavage/methylation domain-containing protein